MNWPALEGFTPFRLVQRSTHGVLKFLNPQTDSHSRGKKKMNVYHFISSGSKDLSQRTVP